MKAWDELQQWLVMNVGSKEADECLEIARRLVLETVNRLDPSYMGGGPMPLGDVEINRDPLPYWKNKA